MKRKLDKTHLRKELEILKEKVPGLIADVQEIKKWTMQDIADYLNEKLKEKIPKYKIKSKSAFDKWVQKESDSNKFKGAPNNKEVKIVVEALQELLAPPIQELIQDYESVKSALEQLFSGLVRNIPPDFEDFWHKRYNKTFKLYNWPNKFSILDILKIADFKKELDTLNNSFPQHTGIYSQISKLLPFAKENEDGQGSYLAYGLNNTDKDFGVYLWNINKYYEFPVFIANSVTDLIAHHIITLDEEDNLQFDNEKYLNETFEKNMKGCILLLNFNTHFNDVNEIHTHFKKLAAFYKTAFRMFNHDGTINFEVAGELITVSMEIKDFRITYKIKDGDLFLFIEKLNDDLNKIDISNFCRPKRYGYFLINRKYLAYLRLDIATDLIQKGYINSQFKMLPMLAFYNPKFPNTIYDFQILAEMDKLENQKITWIE